MISNSNCGANAVEGTEPLFVCALKNRRTTLLTTSYRARWYGEPNPTCCFARR